MATTTLVKTRTLRGTLLLAALGAGICGSLPARVSADGGTLRCVQRLGDWQVSVFTSPTPLRAGPAEINVLVQEQATGQPGPDAPVALELSEPGMPGVLRVVPTRAAATNKLMQAALVDLTTPGTWRLAVLCDAALPPRDGWPRHSDRRLEIDLAVGPPLPQWLAHWPWFCWPLAAVALFACHRMLAGRQKASPARE